MEKGEGEVRFLGGWCLEPEALRYGCRLRAEDIMGVAIWLRSPLKVSS
mgnify:CR=1 FL=1